MKIITTTNILMILFITTLTSICTYTDEDKKELELQVNLRNNNQLQIKKFNQICYKLSVKNTQKEEIATADFAIFDNVRHKKIARIGDIQVNEEYRKNNIGSEIVTNIVDFTRAENCTLISLFSIHSTQRFYEKLGFTYLKSNAPTTCEMEKIL